ncbi:unnamed protein product [Ambrosiozyma monospora]|uniref:Unnamed protein product n=1 Tax=Ambrosiozyma monospora TaxID=43982 RepID=A0ACB5TAC6_AMBMO|nr:unnamed protein product [Ambrosiozyma monospora]
MSDQFFNSWMDQESRIPNNPLLNLSDSNSTTPKSNAGPVTPKLGDTVNLVSINSNSTSTSTSVSTKDTPSYTMNNMFDIYKSMAANNQFIPVPTDEAFRSSTISAPLHVQLLEEKGNTFESQSDTKESQGDQGDISKNLGSLSLTDAINDRPFISKAGTGMSSQNLFNADPSSQQDSSGGLNQKSVIATSLLGANNSPKVGSRSVTPLSNIQPQHGSMGTGQAPGMINPPPGLAPPNLLDPEQINWYYLDPNGNQQGPFTGKMMHEWHSAKYLGPTLNVRREGETTYRTLQEFSLSVGNVDAPFLVKLPPVISPQAAGFPAGFPGGPHPMLHQGSFNQGFNSGTNLFGAANGSTNSIMGVGNGLGGGSQFFGNPAPGAFSQQPGWGSTNDFLSPSLYGNASPFLPKSDLNVGLPLNNGVSFSLVGANATSVSSPLIASATPLTSTSSATPLVGTSAVTLTASDSNSSNGNAPVEQAIEGDASGVDQTLEAIKSKVIDGIFGNENVPTKG